MAKKRKPDVLAAIARAVKRNGKNLLLRTAITKPFALFLSIRTYFSFNLLWQALHKKPSELVVAHE